jgi:hypothetical protein
MPGSLATTASPNPPLLGALLPSVLRVQVLVLVLVVGYLEVVAEEPSLLIS